MIAPHAWGVYAHVPWCAARCPYCAFAVVPGLAPPDPRAWIDRLLAEHEVRRPDFEGAPATVYFGGGTPSRLSATALGEVLTAFGATEGAEVTVEANPEDVSDRWLAGVLAIGVNRVSLGVQTFDPTVAKRLGRARSSAAAAEVTRRLRQARVRFSVDLIFAVPGEPTDRLERDLDALLAADPGHVSLYGLTFEEGTRFERARRGGRLHPVDDDRWRDDYDHLVRRLRVEGFERYEVSNFARPGERSRHNEGYWSDRPYLGLGPSAHGYAPDGRRWTNHETLSDWLAAANPSAAEERPDPRARATDLLVSSLRAADGVDLDRLARRSGMILDDGAVAVLIAGGLCERDGRRLRLTDAGFPVCDALVARLVDALRPQ